MNKVTNNNLNILTMKIKFISKNQIKLNNRLYRCFKVGELPKKFAFIYDKDQDTDGINQYFNYKGLTYISDSYFN